MKLLFGSLLAVMAMACNTEGPLMNVNTLTIEKEGSQFNTDTMAFGITISNLLNANNIKLAIKSASLDPNGYDNYTFELVDPNDESNTITIRLDGPLPFSHYGFTKYASVYGSLNNVANNQKISIQSGTNMKLVYKRTEKDFFELVVYNAEVKPTVVLPNDPKYNLSFKVKLPNISSQ